MEKTTQHPPRAGWHLLSYDVAGDRRRARLYRYLKGEALAIQRSVFLLHGDAATVRRVLQHAAGLIDARRDDLRVYPVVHPARLWVHGHTRSPLPGQPARPAKQGWWQLLFPAWGRRKEKRHAA